MLRNTNINVLSLIDCGSFISLKSARVPACLTKIRKGLLTSEANEQFTPLLKFVRYRKPSWAHIAGSKLHRVIVRKRQEPDELNEFKKKFQHYRTMMKSLREGFLEEVKAQEELENAKRVENVVDGSRMEYVIKMNNEWNQKSAEIRKNFEQEEIMAKEKEFEILKKEIEEAKAARQAEAKRQVERIKQEHFIDVSNLDEAIEESLNKRSVFNFFIDKEGRRFVENFDGTVTLVDKDGNPIESDETKLTLKTSKSLETDTDENSHEHDDSALENSCTT